MTSPLAQCPTKTVVVIVVVVAVVVVVVVVVVVLPVLARSFIILFLALPVFALYALIILLVAAVLVVVVLLCKLSATISGLSKSGEHQEHDTNGSNNASASEHIVLWIDRPTASSINVQKNVHKNTPKLPEFENSHTGAATCSHLECWAASVGSLLSLKSVAAGSPLLAAGCGAGAGALHTLSGPDHLAALAPLALRVRKGPGAAFRTGMFWGSGHDWDEDQNQESVQTSFSWKTFGTGMLSGMHPDALLLCLPALTLPTRSAGLIFLASFGAGSMLAMGGYTAALRAACRSLGEESVRKVSILASVMALTLGVGVCASSVGLLVRWFKHEFFSWTNAPRCEHCGSTETKTVGRADPTPEEKHFKANTVEVAACSKCGGQTRFPRYNDPAKLLQTRTGRCGEWANCFTLVCRSLGYEARHVHDWTDHVWTEVFSDSKQRWLHVDACEAALDSPLMYEKGWGKKLTYCIGFARDHVVDVTRRYTQSFEELLPRRTQCSEEELKKAVSAIDEFALDRSLVPYPATVAVARRALLSARADAEAQETTHVATKAEEVGRTSGDASWRAQRGELGANDAAKKKALECSETGLEQAGTSLPSTGYEGAQDAQAALRARVAKLMATGLSANDALLKVLEEAKQKAC
eukprot:s3646_g9.t1